eukprot:3458491-Pyramimonas_sp.AAC.1
MVYVFDTAPGRTRAMPTPIVAAEVLLVRDLPGTAPRARTRSSVNQLPEILARLWPVGRRIFPWGI